jgi:hypothetical protein
MHGRRNRPHVCGCSRCVSDHTARGFSLVAAPPIRSGLLIESGGDPSPNGGIRLDLWFRRNVDRRRRFANSIRIPEQGGPAPHCLGRDISKDNGDAEFETA